MDVLAPPALGRTAVDPYAMRADTHRTTGRRGMSRKPDEFVADDWAMLQRLPWCDADTGGIATWLTECYRLGNRR